MAILRARKAIIYARSSSTPRKINEGTRKCSIKSKHPRPFVKPTFTHGYKPTLQSHGKHRSTRGATPKPLSDEEWEKSFNAWDSKLRREGKWTIDEAKARRLSGFTRAKAIEGLIKMVDSKLAADFKDDEASKVLDGDH